MRLLLLLTGSIPSASLPEKQNNINQPQVFNAFKKILFYDNHPSETTGIFLRSLLGMEVESSEGGRQQEAEGQG